MSTRSTRSTRSMIKVAANSSHVLFIRFHLYSSYTVLQKLHGHQTKNKTYFTRGSSWFNLQCARVLYLRCFKSCLVWRIMERWRMWVLRRERGSFFLVCDIQYRSQWCWDAAHWKKCQFNTCVINLVNNSTWLIISLKIFQTYSRPVEKRNVGNDCEIYPTFHGVILPTRFDIASCCFFLFFCSSCCRNPQWSKWQTLRRGPTFNSKHGNFNKMLWNLWIEHDWKKFSTVDGRNPAPPDMYESCKWDIYYINWCGISSMNSIILYLGFQWLSITAYQYKLVVPLQGCWDRSSSRARKHKNSKCPDGGIKNRIGLKNPQKVLSVEVLALWIHLIWTRFVASDTVIQSFSAWRFVFVSLVKCSPRGCVVSRVDRWSHIPGVYAIYLPWILDELGLTSISLTASKWTTGSLSYFIYFYLIKVLESGNGAKASTFLWWYPCLKKTTKISGQSSGPLGKTTNLCIRILLSLSTLVMPDLTIWSVD